MPVLGLLQYKTHITRIPILKFYTHSRPRLLESAYENNHSRQLQVSLNSSLYISVNILRFVQTRQYDKNDQLKVEVMCLPTNSPSGLSGVYFCLEVIITRVRIHFPELPQYHSGNSLHSGQSIHTIQTLNGSR